MAKGKRQQRRLEARNERNRNRYHSKEVAYEHGIDPDASKWEGISSLGESASKGISNIFGFGNKPGKSGDPLAPGQSGSGSGMIWIIVLALLAIFGMSGKKSRA